MMVKTGHPDFYESIFEVVSVFSSRREPGALLRTVVESVAGATGSKACSLMLLTPDREILLHTAAHGLSTWYLRIGPLKVSQALSEVLEGKTVIVPDVASDERELYREQAKQEGIVSLLSVPMKLRGSVIGVLRLYTGEPHDFTGEELRFAETAANLAAVALENAGACRAVQEDYEAFCKDMLQWRAEIGGEELMDELVTPAEDESVKIPPGG
jgi:GAF domain-containing protein